MRTSILTARQRQLDRFAQAVRGIYPWLDRDDSDDSPSDRVQLEWLIQVVHAGEMCPVDAHRIVAEMDRRLQHARIHRERAA